MKDIPSRSILKRPGRHVGKSKPTRPQQGAGRQASSAPARAARTQSCTDHAGASSRKDRTPPTSLTFVCVAIVYLLPSRLYCRPRIFTGSTVPPPRRHGSRADAQAAPARSPPVGNCAPSRRYRTFIGIVLYPQ